MGKKRLPDLPDTGRHYVENTLRARLASPGVQKYRPARRPGGAGVALAVLFVAALVGVMIWLARAL